jgi:O-methyltransferase
VRSTEDVLAGWKGRGLSLLYRLYGTLPFLSEFLSVHTKAIGILQAWQLISRNGTPGDYVEFGVYRGDTFKLSLEAARRSFDGRYPGRFFAFDSFQGLPQVESMKGPENVFRAGEYAAPRTVFMKTIARAARGADVQVVEGWFEETLVPATRARLGLSRVAIANIDCDLYESTVHCLDFLGPLVGQGTILMFDDWFLTRGSMRHGEPLAAAEWLARNPDLQLVPLAKYGVAGMMFIVNVSAAGSPFFVPRPGT